jgi:small subunit ribosomal protein S8
MLTRIRNSLLIKARKVNVINTKLTVNIAEILKKEGFIDSFELADATCLTENGVIKKYITIFLKYKGPKQVSYITKIKRVSKPGLRTYSSYKRLQSVAGGVGLTVCAICFLSFIR